MSVIEIAPIVKTLDVRRSAADAFRMFVHEMDKWWPLENPRARPGEQYEGDWYRS